MRCPVCRAENGEEVACRRCRADLSLLISLENQRRRELAAAQSAVLAQNTTDVLDHATAAHELRHGEDSARLVAAGHLLARDFAAAFRWHQFMKKIPVASHSAD